MTEERGIRYFPIALFSSVMGVAGVAIAMRLIENIYLANHIISTIILIVATGLFLVNGIILLYRMVKHSSEVQEDLQHPVKMNFFGAISISLFLLAVLYADIQMMVSFSLWVIGAFLQVFLTLTFLSKLI